MRARRKPIVASAVTGFIVAAVLFAYLQLTLAWSDALLLVSLILCPPSLLTAAFIDIHPSMAAIIIMWSVVALMNATLYGAVGAFLLGLLWKSD